MPFLRIAACLSAAYSFSFAQITTDFARPSFTVFHEMGRVEEASFDNTLAIENQWVHRSGAWVNLRGQRGDRLSLDLIFGGVYYTNTKEQSDASTKTRFFAASVPRFDVTYLFGQDVANPFMKLNAGIFNYKYNEYSRNLGEYAFRSGTYPGWISTGGITYVGVNSAQVTGFRLSQNMGASFSHELLATLETEVLPTYDMSLTYMAKYNWNNVFKVGGGVQLARILPAVPSRTNPTVLRDPSSGAVNTSATNRYFKHNGEWYLDYAGYYDILMSHPSTTGADSARYQRAKLVLDSARGRDLSGNPLDGGAGNPLISVDYENYNASGVKPIATFSFDPKPLLGGLPMLGANDLVLYGEAALLGVKDYPIFYDDWTKRLPVMVGFNFPTFKLLDVLALEVEYYGSDYPDNFQGLISGGVQGTPWPTLPPGIGGYNASDWQDDNVKWSVYAQRKVVDGVTLSAQVARDHARAWAYPTGKTYWGIINDDNDWYWMLKLTANL